MEGAQVIMWTENEAFHEKETRQEVIDIPERKPLNYMTYNEIKLKIYKNHFAFFSKRSEDSMFYPKHCLKSEGKH